MTSLACTERPENVACIVPNELRFVQHCQRKAMVSLSAAVDKLETRPRGELNPMAVGAVSRIVPGSGFAWTMRSQNVFGQ